MQIVDELQYDMDKLILEKLHIKKKIRQISKLFSNDLDDYDIEYQVNSNILFRLSDYLVEVDRDIHNLKIEILELEETMENDN